MEEAQQLATWTELAQLVENEDLAPIGEFLESLPADEAARAISRLPGEMQTHLLTTLPPDGAANLIGGLSDAQAAELVEHLDPQSAAAIVHELPSNEQADLLGDLSASEADAILAELEPQEAEHLRQLTGYSDDVAGGLMVTEFLAYSTAAMASEVIDDLRTNADRYRDYQVQYAFVTDAAGRLMGVLRLRDLLLARPEQRLDALMIPRPLSVLDSASLDELRAFFDDHHFLGVPVADRSGKMLGMVRRLAVEEGLGERIEDEYRKTQGIVKEELRTMPLLVRSRRRLAWLSINILLNVLAASVIAFYQETLAQVIALAVFLPIISDMSGCSGNQAVAVSMRELTLGLVRPGELLRVLGKEASVGIINGLALGMLIALVAFLWQGNPYLGLVVGVAMAVNTLIAVSLGGALPLLMKTMRMDPALASGPILTTVTDMCGFFIILSLAAVMLPWLTTG